MEKFIIRLENGLILGPVIWAERLVDAHVPGYELETGNGIFLPSSMLTRPARWTATGQQVNATPGMRITAFMKIDADTVWKPFK